MSDKFERVFDLVVPHQSEVERHLRDNVNTIAAGAKPMRGYALVVFQDDGYYTACNHVGDTGITMVDLPHMVGSRVAASLERYRGANHAPHPDAS